jgi:hypothetical protein
MTVNESLEIHLKTAIAELEERFTGFGFDHSSTGDNSILAVRLADGAALSVELEPPPFIPWPPLDLWECKVFLSGVEVPHSHSRGDEPSYLAIFSMGQAVEALRRADDQPLLDRLNAVASQLHVGLSFDWWDVSTRHNPPHALRGGFDVADSDNVFEIELISKASGAWVCRIITGYYGSEDDDEDITSLIGEARSTDPIEAFQQAIDIAFRATQGAADAFRGLALGLRGVG